MSSLRSLIVSTGFCFLGTIASAQMTPEELKSLVDARSSNLSGFQELLDDPDPRRSLAAVEGMLASGDSDLERMALRFALTNPDPTIRAAALEHHFSKLPALSVSFDASNVKEEEMETFIRVIKGIGGSMGPDKIGSFSYQPAAYDEDDGCFPHASNKRACAMRLGAGFVSLYFSAPGVEGRWVNFQADETGTLRGGVNFDFNGTPAGSVPLTIRLLD
ncbi:hypothetical protein [Celeribacter halophilus]|jgi:hypothetical protein|uniref:hypothetical protein n=1 Tax=Celeribacter halophilus TaxID=576117 RepID=UPI003A95D4A4